MSIIRLTDFQPWDLDLLKTLRNEDKYRAVLLSPLHARLLRDAGNAFSAWVPEGLMACIGVGVVDGFLPEAWMIGGDLVDKYRFSYHREARRMLASMARYYGWTKVQTTAQGSDVRAQRWVEALGFQRLDGEDVVHIHPVFKEAYLRYVKEY